MYHFDFAVIQNYLVKSMITGGGRLLTSIFREFDMKKILVGLGCCLAASGAFAYYGGSNLDYPGYPDFSVYRPNPPFSHDRYAYDSYRNEVEEYVRKAKEYVENGNNDIETIGEKQREATRKANQVIEEFNDWASRKY